VHLASCMPHSRLQQPHRKAAFRKRTWHSACIVASFFSLQQRRQKKPLSASAPGIQYASFFFAPAVSCQKPLSVSALCIHDALLPTAASSKPDLSSRQTHRSLRSRSHLLNRFNNESSLSTSIVPIAAPTHTPPLRLFN
jgi:hypothetical protein